MRLFLGHYFVTALLVFNTLANPLTRRQSCTPTPPSEDPFYAAPSNIATYKPGAIIRSRNVPCQLQALGLFNVNYAQAVQLLFRTSDNEGHPVAALTTLIKPEDADPTQLLSYQVAEDAANVDCAPSYSFQSGSQNTSTLGQGEVLNIESGLNQGWYVNVPDFLGPKSAFLANRASAYTTLDSIRAAHSSGALTGIHSTPTTILWGYSGGSIASGWAAELAPTYAPELYISGAALGGTVPNIGTVTATVNGGPFAGLIAAGIIGLSNAYPVARKVLKTGLVPSTSAQFLANGRLCFEQYIEAFAFQDMYKYTINPNILNVNPALRIINANQQGQYTPKAPLYIYKAAQDEISPIADTNALVSTYCSKGVAVEYVIYELTDHIELAITGAPGALNWLTGIMTGTQATGGCSTSTIL